MVCPKGKSVAGHIQNKPVLEKNWVEQATEFQRVIERWNEKTKRFAVIHQGFCERARFCGTCGRNMEAFHKNNPYHI